MQKPSDPPRPPVVDLFLCACAGALEPQALRAVADQVDYLAMFLDESGEIAEAGRASRALRLFAENLD